MIKIDGVTKVFDNSKGQNFVAVDKVSCDIREGEVFGIIGYSGAGKSTLIRLLNGLEQPTTGVIEVAGFDLSQLNKHKLREIRQEIGMVFQHFNLLWSRTVRENITFPLEIAGVPKSQRNKRAEKLIQLVGLGGKEDVYPSQLSGGQKQRVGIARALANKPKVLLCDEATSALDPETTDSILELLMEINRQMGLTIVLITHEMHVIQKICHRVAVMDTGKIVEMGDVLNVFKNPQNTVTQRFVQQVKSPDEEKGSLLHIAEKYAQGKIVHLTFVGESAESPILSKAIRDFDVNVNIIQGKISQTINGPLGTLTIHVDGPDAEVTRVLEFLQSHEIGVEVESYGK